MAGFRYVIGLDVGLKRDSTVAAICHLEHSVVTLDRLGVWTGTRLRPVRLAEVEEWLTKAAREYRAELVLDPWQAAQLTERLRRRSVSVREYAFTAQSVGRLASTLFLLLRERALRLPDDEALLDELANVRLRETSPGLVRMDHDADKHDDRAIALALAAHRLVERGEFAPAVMRTFVPQGRVDVGPTFADRRRPTAPGAARPADRRPRRLGLPTWAVDNGTAEYADLMARGSR